MKPIIFQRFQQNKNIIFWGLIWLGIWNGLIWGFPLIVKYLPFSFSVFIFKIFLPLCHHHPSSTFLIDSVLLPVCVRCSSIYLGAFVGFIFASLLFVFKTDHLRNITFFWVYVSSFSMLLDVGLNWLGWKEPLWSYKVITGVFFGITISIFLTLHFLNQSDRKRSS